MVEGESRKEREPKNMGEKVVTTFIVAVIGFAIFALFFTGKSLLFPSEKILSTPENALTGNTITHPSKMSLTSFDVELARRFMDKDNDGRCDSCGMPVEMCMGSGQLQCNMDPASTIGVLESQHVHADWKLYIDGEAVDLTGKDHMTRMQSGQSVSSFIHIDSGAPAPEKTGDILHMHATGVPLWIFFESVGLELPEGAKAYVNGKEMQDYEEYVFNDLDRILITDGKGDIDQQLSTLTDFAKIH